MPILPHSRSVYILSISTNNCFQTLLVAKCPEDLPTSPQDTVSSPPVDLNSASPISISTLEPEDSTPIPLPWLKPHYKPFQNSEFKQQNKSSSPKRNPTTSTGNSKPQPKPSLKTKLTTSTDNSQPKPKPATAKKSRQVGLLFFNETG